MRVSPGGRVKRIVDKGARQVPGVQAVLRIEDAVAVVGDHFWAAKKGLEALDIEWYEGPRANTNIAEVRDRLPATLAYTTVLTALSRLHDKGALGREPAGRAFAYSLPADPATVDASMTARRMSRLLDAGNDRAGVLARFVADLSPADEQVLAELLAQGRPADGEDTA